MSQCNMVIKYTLFQESRNLISSPLSAINWYDFWQITNFRGLGFWSIK